MALTQSNIDLALVWYFCNNFVSEPVQMDSFILIHDDSEPMSFAIQDCTGTVANYIFSIDLQYLIEDTCMLQQVADIVRRDYGDPIIETLVTYFITIFSAVSEAGRTRVIAKYPIRIGTTSQDYACMLIATEDGYFPITITQCLGLESTYPLANLMYRVCLGCNPLPYANIVTLHPPVPNYSQEELAWCRANAPDIIQPLDDAQLVQYMHNLYMENCA